MAKQECCDTMASELNKVVIDIPSHSIARMFLSITQNKLISTALSSTTAGVLF